MSKKKGGASKEAMRDLHTKVAEVLADALDGPEVDSRILGHAIAFLKNNGVVAEDDSPEMQELKKKAGNVISYPFDPRREATG